VCAEAKQTPLTELDEIYIIVSSTNQLPEKSLRIRAPFDVPIAALALVALDDRWVLALNTADGILFYVLSGDLSTVLGQVQRRAEKTEPSFLYSFADQGSQYRYDFRLKTLKSEKVALYGVPKRGGTVNAILFDPVAFAIEQVKSQSYPIPKDEFLTSLDEVYLESLSEMDDLGRVHLVSGTLEGKVRVDVIPVFSSIVGDNPRAWTWQAKDSENSARLSITTPTSMTIDPRTRETVIGFYAAKRTAGVVRLKNADVVVPTIGVGASIVSIPTLSGWTLVLTALALLYVGMVFRKRSLKNANSFH
jgi:hypothetical protein